MSYGPVWQSTIPRPSAVSPRAEKVIAYANDEVRRLGHKYIGTEHLLLGLIREGEGIAAGVLESLGNDLGKVRAAVEFLDDPAPHRLSEGEKAKLQGIVGKRHG